MSTEQNEPSRDLIVMIGMTLSGKSFHVNVNYASTYQVVSSKDIRKAMYTTKLDIHDLPYAIMDIIVRSHMLRGFPIIIDENNETIESLFIWKRLAHEFGYCIRVILLDTPFEMCIDRLKSILGKDEIPDDMYEQLKKESKQINELKEILNMKYQSVIDEVKYITYNTED